MGSKTIFNLTDNGHKLTARIGTEVDYDQVISGLLALACTRSQTMIIEVICTHNVAGE